MKSAVNNLRTKLLATKEGRATRLAINALTKHAEKGSVEAKNALAEYVEKGSVEHLRDFACSCLAETVGQADGGLAHAFERGLSNPLTQYWSILGYINILGRGAYEPLTTLACDESIPVDVRGHAVKCLASFSKQQFDRQLPSDPGFWKATDLRLSEIAAWAKAGYPDGQGYSTPNRHNALDKPKTDFEKIVSRLDKKLAKKRRDRQDLVDPTDWFALADSSDVQRITTRWKLPSLYLDFLTRFSPIKVTIASRKFYNNFRLFGASELVEAQNGYSFNPVKQQPIEDWPTDLVVIASHGGDPFVLDLSKSDGVDAPVLTAKHGTGDWDFSEEAGSFAEFLESLAK